MLSLKQIFVLILIMMFQFVINFLNVGVVVYASSNYAEISEVAYSVLSGAIGCIAAIILFYRIKNKVTLAGFYILALITSSIFLSITSFGTAIWFGLFCVCISSLSYLLSSVMSIVSFAISDSVGVVNKNKLVQLSNTFGVLLGVSIGPMIAMVKGEYFFYFITISCVVIGIYYLFIMQPNFRHMYVSKSTNDDLIAPVLVSKIKLWISIYLVWLIGGFFYVIEVPILKNRFSADSNLISMIFALSVCVNMITVVFTPKSFFKNNFERNFMLVASLCVFMGAVYAINNIWVLVPVIVACYGMLNGLFNIMVLSDVSTLSTSDSQLIGFLYIRLFSQLGLICSSYIASLSTLSNTILILFYLTVISLGILVCGNFSLRKKACK